MLLKKYIYFAVNNLKSDPLYKKAVIIGETDDLYKRESQYKPKGIFTELGDVKSFDGRTDLIYPFVDFFIFEIETTKKKNVNDKYIHEILKHEKPFTDLLYKITDHNTKEAFRFYSESLDILYSIDKLKEYIIDYFNEDIIKLAIV